MMPLPGHGYRVVLADPPWKFETWTPDAGNRGPQFHYDLMENDEILALGDRLDLKGRCARDCWLILWTTWTRLQLGIDVLKAWGFQQVSGGAWGKMNAAGTRPAIGTGYILRDSCEPFLIGRRGAPKRLNRGTSNLILAPRREHSRKPDAMHVLIERTFPGPYLEVFARSRRRHWHAWGNETEKFGSEE